MSTGKGTSDLSHRYLDYSELTLYLPVASKRSSVFSPLPQNLQLSLTTPLEPVYRLLTPSLNRHVNSNSRSEAARCQGQGQLQLSPKSISTLPFQSLSLSLVCAEVEMGKELNGLLQNERELTGKCCGLYRRPRRLLSRAPPRPSCPRSAPRSPSTGKLS